MHHAYYRQCILETFPSYSIFGYRAEWSKMMNSFRISLELTLNAREYVIINTKRHSFKQRKHMGFSRFSYVLNKY